jgi:ribose/xylose/arabinose/galactoside ABC-type transport system permease subunit
VSENTTDLVVPQTTDTHALGDDTGITAGATRAAQMTSQIAKSGSVVVLVLVIILASVFSQHFGSLDNLRNIVLGGSFMGVIVVGMTFVIISGGIDLSVGSLFALGAVLSEWMAQNGSSVLAVIVPIVACSAVGLLQGSVIARLGLPPFIVTLAGLLGIRGLDYFLTAEGNTVRQSKPDLGFLKLGQGVFLTLGWPVWIMLILFAIGWWVLNRTAFGQTVQAVGISDSAAELMGLPVRRTKTLVYVISGAMCGIAGLLLVANSNGGQEARVGDAYELTAIASVVIGGTLLSGGIGSMVGSLAGVLLWFVIENIVNQTFQMTPYQDMMISGAFLLLVVIIQAVLARRSKGSSVLAAE